MLKERRSAAESVASGFLMAEHAADKAAVLAAGCISTMLVERGNANLPIGTGLEAIRLVTEAASDLIRGRQRMIEAHRLLADVRDEIGLGFLYGDEFECPKTAHADGSQRLVPLAAVA